MRIQLGPPDWRRIALIESEGEPASFANVLGSPEPEFIVLLVDDPPPGRTWIEVLVDFGIGEWRGIRMAYAILSALELSASSGVIPTFRWVTGEHGLRDPPALEPGNILSYEYSCTRVQRNVPAHRSASPGTSEGTSQLRKKTD